MKLHQLWQWHGTVGRGAYLLWGALLLAVKWNLDRFVLLRQADGSAPNIVDYFVAGGPMTGWFTLEQAGEFAWPLMLASLPFLWAGLVLTVQRLRSAGLPLWLAALFVVPVVKWLLFLVAVLIPQREASPPELPGVRPPNWVERLCPRSRLGSAFAGVGLACALLLGGTVLGTLGFNQYAWGLFVGMPFLAGFLAALVHRVHGARPLRESLLVALLTVLVAALGLVALAIEGVICVVMAAPLAVPLALLGAVLAHFIQPGSRRDVTPRLFCAGVLAVPLMLASERLADAPAPLLEVVSSVEVAAPPERVWQHVVAFTELPAPTEWLFRLGVAYPLRAELRGTGPGAVRHCVFSTGPFVEPIEVWDEPRLLRFGVTSNPPPMQEWTPYQHVHPPHLEGFLASERGQFRLVALSGGHTRLEGTTWYRHNMWPVAYWQGWSDHIIHRIHLRVLRHIKTRAENSPDAQ